MMLAGLRVPDDDVRELARLVGEPTRSVLEKALALGTVVLALTIEDRERLLWALDDARTDALAELRGVLLLEHEIVYARGPCRRVNVWVNAWPSTLCLPQRSPHGKWRSRRSCGR
jgi:hypothetical protein